MDTKAARPKGTPEAIPADTRTAKAIPERKANRK